MNTCDLDVVLYFYGELHGADRARAAAHVRECLACRQRLDELEAIRGALASRTRVEAPPAGDWSGFMRRLDLAVHSIPPALRDSGQESSRFAAAAASQPRSRFAARAAWQQLLVVAAVLAVVTFGVVTAARFRAALPPDGNATPGNSATVSPGTTAAERSPEQSLREVTAEHLERSKLVVLGLAARDPERTTADDWQYERRLAGTLLSDTRLYRIAAQDRGVSDVAGVMRDLETVLLEASLSDSSDKDALERVQKLITKRDLVVKMQVVAGSTGL